MKRTNFIILFSLIFTFVFMPVTTHAAETYDIETQELETINQLVYDYNKYAPYTSETFRPQTNQIRIIFGAWGAVDSYHTYYLEELKSNGVWTVVDQHTIKGTSSITTKPFVTAGNIYRIRATTNTYSNGIKVEVFEYI